MWQVVAAERLRQFLLPVLAKLTIEFAGSCYYDWRETCEPVIFPWPAVCQCELCKLEECLWSQMYSDVLVTQNLHSVFVWPVNENYVGLVTLRNAGFRGVLLLNDELLVLISRNEHTELWLKSRLLWKRKGHFYLLDFRTKVVLCNEDTCVVMDAKSFSVVHEFPTHTKEIWNVYVDHNAAVFVERDNAVLRAWNTDTGQELPTSSRFRSNDILWVLTETERMQELFVAEDEMVTIEGDNVLWGKKKVFDLLDFFAEPNAVSLHEVDKKGHRALASTKKVWVLFDKHRVIQRGESGVPCTEWHVTQEGCVVGVSQKWSVLWK